MSQRTQELPEGAARGWAIYADMRVWRMLFLGFGAGLPFLLVFSTLTGWLRTEGVELTAIGFFSWIGITYSVKVFWAPVVDAVQLPVLSRLLGQRRAWILVGQLCIAGGLVLMALVGPSGQLRLLETLGLGGAWHLGLFALIAVGVAFASATQDIALDAYRIEHAPQSMQAALAATYVAGYRIAVLASGAGALFIADGQGWRSAYLAMAALMALPLGALLLSKRVPGQASALYQSKIADPRDVRILRWLSAGAAGVLLALALVYGVGAGTGGTGRVLLLVTGLLTAVFALTVVEVGRPAASRMASSVIGPFRDFVSRFRWQALAILGFIGLYKLSDISMAAMAVPLYIDLGFSLSEIAAVTKIFGVLVSLVGGFVAGGLVARTGARPMMLVGAVLIAVTNLLFAWLAGHQRDPSLVLPEGGEVWATLLHLATNRDAAMDAFVLTIVGDNFSVGFSAAAFIAYLSGLTNRAYTATQYALFSSLMTLPGKFVGGFSGAAAEAWGYPVFFVYTAALGLPAIALALYLWRRDVAHADAAPG